MRKAQAGKSSPAWPWSENKHVSASEFIRAAEKFLQGKQYTRALEQLRHAQNYEPDNKYILAIIERVLSLSKTESSGALPDSNRYLSVTVGPAFDTGIKPVESQPVEFPQHELIKEFTSIARGYVKIGLPEAAFNALMKAYLIDPIDPEVISCEREVIPVWNSARAHTRSASPPAPATETETPERVELSSEPVEPAEEPPDQPAAPEKPAPMREFSDFELSPSTEETLEEGTSGSISDTEESFASAAEPEAVDEEQASSVIDEDPWGTARPRPQAMTPEEEAQRAEALMQRKESERQEREREIYRAASRLPRILGDTQKDEPGFHLSRPSRASRAARGILRRFKKG